MADTSITPEQGDIIHDALTALWSGKPFTVDPKKLPPNAAKALMDLNAAKNGGTTTFDKFKNLFTGNLNKIPGWGEYKAGEVYDALNQQRGESDPMHALQLAGPGGVSAAETNYQPKKPLPEDQLKALRQRFDAVSGYSYARNPADKLKLMQLFDPETAATQAEDPWGNPYVIKGGKKLYINAPGASYEDLRELGDQTIATAPQAIGAETAPVKGLLAKLLSGAIVQGSGSAAMDLVAKNAGSGQDISLKDVGINALGGASGEALAPVLGKLGNVIFNNIRGTKFFTPAGKMKPGGADLLRKAGLDWDSLSGDIQNRIKLLADKSTSPEDLVRLLASQDLPAGPIRLTKAQATGDIGAYADEDLLRSGALGDSAAGKMKKFDSNQADDIRRNVQGIAERINPGKERQTTWGQGGAGATEELQGQKQSFANVLDDSYDAARDAGKTAYYPSLDNIKAQVVNNPEISPIMNPQLQADDKFMAAWKDYESTFGSTGGKPGTNDPSVSVNSAFSYLQRLNASIKNNPTNASLRALKKQLQRGLADDVLVNTVKGDPGAVEAFLKSNKMYRDFANTYKADDIVQTLTEQTFDPMNPGIKKFKVDPADGSKLILGAGRLGFINKPGMRQALTTLKTQLPAEQWNNLREEVFLRMLGWTDKDMFGQGQLVQSAAQFKRAMADIQQKSPEIYNTLFSSQEKGTLQRFGEEYGKATLAPPTKSTMGSRTTPLAMRALRTTVGAISPKLKFAMDLVAKPLEGKAGVTKALGPSLGGDLTLPPNIALPKLPSTMLSLPGTNASQGIVDKYYGDNP